MKKFSLSFFILLVAAFLFAANKFSSQESSEPWTDKQLIQPAELAKNLNDANSKKPLIYSIGFGGGIKNSIEFGAVKEKVNLEKLKSALEKLPKDSPIVLYCGCCPFEHCPNVRPAFQLLNEMKFINHKLLNLSHNLKTDWIDKGYPVN
jgi:hypothetical protein